MLRAVLFDMDGVLVHSDDAWYATMVDTAHALGNEPLSRHDFHRSFGQGIAVDAERFYGGRDPAEVAATYDRCYPAHLGDVRVARAARAVLAAVRERRLPSAVVTNSTRAVAEAVLARHRLRVDVLVAATDVARDKPAPDGVLEACRQLDVPPEATLFVGDTVSDREAAQAAGTAFAGLGVDGGHTLARLEDLPALVDRLRTLL